VQERTKPLFAVKDKIKGKIASNFKWNNFHTYHYHFTPKIHFYMGKKGYCISSIRFEIYNWCCIKTSFSSHIFHPVTKFCSFFTYTD